MSRIVLSCALAALLGACASPAGEASPSPSPSPDKMHLGAFSLSLAVKDLAASRAFYEALGFESVMGDPARNWLILRNADQHTIGLFQGMFPQNIMTFNPGWDRQAAPLAEFTDVRELQAELEARGLTFATRAEPGTTGPASFILVDPDGNQILVDQHVP